MTTTSYTRNSTTLTDVTPRTSAQGWGQGRGRGTPAVRYVAGTADARA